MQALVSQCGSMVWATPDDLRRELRASIDELPDAEANDWLRTAYLKIQAKIGRNGLVDVFVVREDDSGVVYRDFYVFFKPLISVAEVYVNDSLIDPTNYTVDLANGKVSIDASVELRAGDEVLIYYYPEILRLWQLKLAAFYVLQALAINTGSGTTDIKLERYVEEINSIEDVVMSKPKVAAWREHKTPRTGTWNWVGGDDW